MCCIDIRTIYLAISDPFCTAFHTSFLSPIGFLLSFSFAIYLRKRSPFYHHCSRPYHLPPDIGLYSLLSIRVPTYLHECQCLCPLRQPLCAPVQDTEAEQNTSLSGVFKLAAREEHAHTQDVNCITWNPAHRLVVELKYVLCSRGYIFCSYIGIQRLSCS